VRLIRAQPVLLGAISLDLFAVLFGGAVALLPALAEDRLGVGAVGLGWLRAAGGIGAAIVTLGLVLRPVRRRVGKVLLGVVATFGLATILLGLTTSFGVALVAMAVLSGADAVSVFIRSTLVPLVTPAAARGRVLAVENIFIGASNEAGDFESGVAGAAFGASAAVVLGGIGTLVVAAAWWVLFPRLRDIDAFPRSPTRTRAGPGRVRRPPPAEDAGRRHRRAATQQRRRRASPSGRPGERRRPPARRRAARTRCRGPAGAPHGYRPADVAPPWRPPRARARPRLVRRR
jgi:predicted MFS family arabinose efflux permease